MQGEENETLKKICPRCFGLTLKVDDCPVDGPDEGLYCTSCNWTHVDGSPLMMERALREEHDETILRMLEAQCATYTRAERAERTVAGLRAELKCWRERRRRR